MNQQQRTAIEENRTHLSSALLFSRFGLHPFLDHLRQYRIISSEEYDLIRNSNSTVGMLLFVLDLLTTKDEGWDSIISYLKHNRFSALSERLRKSAGEITVNESTRFESTKLVEKFSLALAEYYQSNYANLRTLWDVHKHVKDVWVQLQLEEQTGIEHEPYDHSRLLQRLTNSQSCFALVKGEPGVGKTTLVKKIAYDWAVARLKNEITSDQFNIVLAVPLRDVGSCDDFLSLAVDFFVQKVKLEHSSRNLLIEQLNELNFRLLICLDGLDEYHSYSESPFKHLFAAPFKRTTVNTQPLPSLGSYKLLVTSRPYACAVGNDEFFPLRFKILIIDPSHVEKFCKLYCQTPDGVKKVMRYLVEKSELVIKVPLILTFVCFLADSDEKIPTNLTLLYHRFAYHMVKREWRNNKLEEQIDLDLGTSTGLWVSTPIIKSIAKLAFLGCKEAKLEFSPEDMKTTQITDDAFICGFLLNKYGFEQECRMTEFPHRSFQEFFGALHCYHLVLTDLDCQTERDFVKSEILAQNSQLSRFLFGICSIERKFQRLVDWLMISPDEAKKLMSKLYILFLGPSGILADCSEEEMGQFGNTITLTLSS